MTTSCSSVSKGRPGQTFAKVKRAPGRRIGVATVRAATWQVAASRTRATVAEELILPTDTKSTARAGGGCRRLRRYREPGWDLTLVDQRPTVDGRGSSAGLQAVANHREAVLSTEDRPAGTSASLKDVGRIQGSLALYFFVLLVPILLERELRQAMTRRHRLSAAVSGGASLPLAHRRQGHQSLRAGSTTGSFIGDHEPQSLITELTKTATPNHQAAGAFTR